MIGWLSAMFVNVPLLLGAVAAAIPIILHLVYRKRAPRVVFGTLRFIRMSAERTARRRRIREWLLLLLRAAAIFLLAVGLAGPIIQSAGVGTEGSAAVAIVMDNSYSMGAVFEGRSLYARAREQALDILRNLGQEGQAAVVYAWPGSGNDTQEILTADRNRLADELAAGTVSLIPGDLAAAIVRAETILQTAPTKDREIYILTDLQKAGWREGPPKSSEDEVTTVVIDCGPGRQRNLIVSDVQVAAARPAAGVPVTLSARIRNLGQEPETVGVGLYVDLQKDAERTVEVDAGGKAETAFAYTFESAGARTGWVDLDLTDALPLDNRRYFCIDVPERIRVAVVRETVGALPLRDEAFFLVPALNPLAGSGKGSTIEPTLMLRGDLTGARLSDYAVVFLLNLPKLDGGEITALTQYIRGGGGVVVFPGDRTEVDAWNAIRIGADAEPLLPAELGDVLGDARGDDTVGLGEVDREHPILGAFSRMPRRFFDAVEVRRYFDLRVMHGSRARVPLPLNNGKPFLVEKEIGPARVLLFCTSATAEWSNLPSRTLYLPLLHQITYDLARSQSASAEYAAGSAIRFSPTHGVPVEVDVTHPSGTVSRAAVEEAGMALFRDTAEAGIYTWREAGEGGRHGAFVVNPDTRESDLEAFSHEEFREEILPGRKLHFAQDAEEARTIAARMRKGVSLATPILFVVIVVFLAECFLANHAPNAAMGGAKRGRAFVPPLTIR